MSTGGTPAHEPERDADSTATRPAPTQQVRAGDGEGRLTRLLRTARSWAATGASGAVVPPPEGAGPSAVIISEKARAQASFVMSNGFDTAPIVAGFSRGGYTFGPVPAATPGTLGYQRFEHEVWCGGRSFGNGTGALPAGTTFHEWDIKAFAPGQRGAERLVVSATGRSFYTPDHYASFLEIRTT